MGDCSSAPMRQPVRGSPQKVLNRYCANHVTEVSGSKPRRPQSAFVTRGRPSGAEKLRIRLPGAQQLRDAELGTEVVTTPLGTTALIDWAANLQLEDVIPTSPHEPFFDAAIAAGDAAVAAVDAATVALADANAVPAAIAADEARTSDHSLSPHL